jgi:hypothetical protein
MSLVLNIDQNQLCPVCLNDGWVELKGTMQQFGVTYEKGMTACKWCQQGQRNHERTDRPGSMGHVPIEFDYAMEDVVPPTTGGEGITFEEYVKVSPEDPNVPAAIELLSKPDDKAHLYVLAYQCRREAWGPADADLWLRSTLGERQVEWVLKRAALPPT